ncbi:MAG: hypothetical protein PHV74_15055 [Dehalococcoidia bacterium]|nr:hypothetical protein [Dehalococcoidia bacterium]
MGILIPIRDIIGRVVGLQVRGDGKKTGKYKWVSSKGFPQGCSSGAPIHVASRESGSSDIWVTEGALKSDIAALRLKATVLAIAGVSNYDGIFPILKELKPRRIILALDMDRFTNPTVKQHCEAFICRLRCYYPTFEATWDSRYKGIDDLVTGAE